MEAPDGPPAGRRRTLTPLPFGTGSARSLQVAGRVDVRDGVVDLELPRAFRADTRNRPNAAGLNRLQPEI